MEEEGEGGRGGTEDGRVCSTLMDPVTCVGMRVIWMIRGVSYSGAAYGPYLVDLVA